MQLVKKLMGTFMLASLLLSFFAFAPARASEWDYNWGYKDEIKNNNYDSQLNNRDYSNYNYSNYDVTSSSTCGTDGIKCPDWNNTIVSSYQNEDYYPEVSSQDYTNQYPSSNWDFANENNWSNNNYWQNQGDWGNWYNNQRNDWSNYYQANVQNRDYHPLNINYYDNNDRYSVLADNNNYQRRMIWANQNYPIGRFMDYPDSWYNSWRNWQKNYAKGVAIRDRNNSNNVIIIANANDIGGQGNVINIERATVVVDSDLFNQICRMVDQNQNNENGYDFRFNRYNNTLGYNADGNWQSYNASYSYN